MGGQFNGLGWFGPRKMGFGATPTSWQGWLVSVIFVIGLIVVQFAPGLSIGNKVAGSLLLGAVFTLVVIWTYSSQSSNP